MMLVKDNSVLLVYHSYIDNWHFPGGGMKRGETVLEAACREAYEEAGAVVTGEPRLLGLYTGSTRGRSDNTAVFVCEDFTLQTPTDRWEIIGRAFFGLDNLPANITRGYRQVVTQYRQGGPPARRELVKNWQGIDEMVSMDFSLIVRGFILGFAIAAPVGPIGLLCIQRTLNQGQLVGLASGLGAATADAFYGAVAAFGLTIVSAFLIEQQFWLALVGGLFLCYLGVRTFLVQPRGSARPNSEAKGIGGAYMSTFLLTITNPMTILAFVAIFAGAGLATAGGDALAAAWMVVGVFLGSAAWWFLLSGGVALLRSHINATVLLWVNRAAGAILVIFGVLAIGRAFVA